MSERVLSLLLVFLLVILCHFGFVPADLGWLQPWAVALLLERRRRSQPTGHSTTAP
jgi:hypothetical protein